ncbi:MAG: tRNA preQ1(34) S-adenosylmethionine ribosyltransferase-isomerase QueA [Brevinematales bacterium]|jgi:S-adenosylmethionine:tRNA ribosyltransferase-isomerase
MITLDDINYLLPEDLIASHPPEKRGDSRLLAVSRKDKSFTDSYFRCLPDMMNPGDCLVMNNTRVFKARLKGKTPGGDKNIEILLIERLDDKRWISMVKNSKKIPAGTHVNFHDEEAVILEHDEDMRIVSFMSALTFDQIDNIGEVPLPPYIIKKRKRNSENVFSEEDGSRYQSLLARHNGSVAAPTASLHFTEEMLSRLKQKGIGIAFVTLHVGPGTFKPVDTDIPDDYRIHREWMEVPGDTVKILQKTRKEGGRVIAVGTTVVRALETMAGSYDSYEQWESYRGSTRLFIKNDFKFKATDALITNFHMPKSSLLLLVYSFGGMDLIKKAYKHAVKNMYRFLSYGDAMFIY